MILSASATGLPPSEWIPLEHRDIDREARIVYVRRAYRNGRLKCPKTDGSLRAVPLQAVALEAIDCLSPSHGSALVFPAPCGGYLDLHNFRHRDWKPTQRTLGIDPIRRVYDLRHTFATFALRAGISTFDLSRYMGASLTMIDRHYGHLAKDGRQHAIALLDAQTSTTSTPWTRGGRARRVHPPPLAPEPPPKQDKPISPLSDSNRRPLPYHGRVRVSRAFTDALGWAR